MTEEWIRIEESKYFISNEGRIKNNKTGRILKQFKVILGDHESMRIKLPIDNTRKTYIIHRLVALAFIPNPDNKPEVDHKDRNPLNNKVNNLRWATRVENCKNRLMISREIIKKIISLNNKGYSIESIYKKIKFK